MPTTQPTKGKGVPKKGENKATPKKTPKQTAAKPTVQPTKGKGIPKPGEPNNTPNHNGGIVGRSHTGGATESYSELGAESGSGSDMSDRTESGETKGTTVLAPEEGEQGYIH